MWCGSPRWHRCSIDTLPTSQERQVFHDTLFSDWNLLVSGQTYVCGFQPRPNVSWVKLKSLWVGESRCLLLHVRLKPCDWCVAPSKAGARMKTSWKFYLVIHRLLNSESLVKVPVVVIAEKTPLMDEPAAALWPLCSGITVRTPVPDFLSGSYSWKCVRAYYDTPFAHTRMLIRWR